MNELTGDEYKGGGDGNDYFEILLLTERKMLTLKIGAKESSQFRSAPTASSSQHSTLGVILEWMQQQQQSLTFSATMPRHQ